MNYYEYYSTCKFEPFEDNEKAKGKSKKKKKFWKKVEKFFAKILDKVIDATISTMSQAFLRYIEKNLKWYLLDQKLMVCWLNDLNWHLAGILKLKGDKG